MTAGYSGTPLAKKLGIGIGDKILTVRAPVELPGLLSPLPEGAMISNRFRTADVALVFAQTATEIEAVLAAPDQAHWSGRRDRALFTLT